MVRLGVSENLRAIRDQNVQIVSWKQQQACTIYGCIIASVLCGDEAKTLFLNNVILSINVLMDNDSRYYFEEWVNRNIAPESRIAIVSTRIKHLPIRPHKFRPHDVRAILLENPASGVMMPLEELRSQYISAQRESDYVITTSLDLIPIQRSNAPQYKLFSDLNGEKAGYEAVLKYRPDPKWNFIDQVRMPASHTEKINPEVVVFKKIGEKRSP